MIRKARGPKAGMVILTFWLPAIRCLKTLPTVLVVDDQAGAVCLPFLFPVDLGTVSETYGQRDGTGSRTESWDSLLTVSPLFSETALAGGRS